MAAVRGVLVHCFRRLALLTAFPGSPAGTLDEAFANVRDALAAVVELYAEEGRSLPVGVSLPIRGEVVWSDALLGAP